MDPDCNRAITINQDATGTAPDDLFPVGLNVLAVDSNKTHLNKLERMLERCMHKVTKCERIQDVLKLLRQDKSRFDVVITNLYTADMDGFQLLKIIQKEMDLPVALMVAEYKQADVWKSIYDVCGYLLKPIRMYDFQILWYRVALKKEYPATVLQQPFAVEDGRSHLTGSHNYDTRSKRKRQEDGEESVEEPTVVSEGKKRMIWTKELHAKFVAAVNQIDKNPTAKKVLECMQKMNVTGLRREQIGSHLQKYRHKLKKGKNLQDSNHASEPVPSRDGRKSHFEQSSSLDSTAACNPQFYFSANQILVQSFPAPQSSVTASLKGKSSFGVPPSMQHLSAPQSSIAETLIANSSTIGASTSMQIFPAPQSRVPAKIVANSSINASPYDQRNLSNSRVQESSYCSSTTALDLPLASTSEVVSLFSANVQGSEEYQCRNLRDTAWNSKSFCDGRSYLMEDDPTHLLIYDDPFKHFDQNEMMHNSHVEDVAPLAIDPTPLQIYDDSFKHFGQNETLHYPLVEDVAPLAIDQNEMTHNPLVEEVAPLAIEYNKQVNNVWQFDS